MLHYGAALILTNEGVTQLNPAEMAGLTVADQAVAQAMRNLQAVKVQQARIYEAVGMDPTRRYSIDRETGEVSCIDKEKE